MQVDTEEPKTEKPAKNICCPKRRSKLRRPKCYLKLFSYESRCESLKANQANDKDNMNIMKCNEVDDGKKLSVNTNTDIMHRNVASPEQETQQDRSDSKTRKPLLKSILKPSSYQKLLHIEPIENKSRLQSIIQIGNKEKCSQLSESLSVSTDFIDPIKAILESSSQNSALINKYNALNEEKNSLNEEENSLNEEENSLNEESTASEETASEPDELRVRARCCDKEHLNISSFVKTLYDGLDSICF